MRIAALDTEVCQNVKETPCEDSRSIVRRPRAFGRVDRNPGPNRSLVRKRSSSRLQNQRSQPHHSRGQLQTPQRLNKN